MINQLFCKYKIGYFTFLCVLIFSPCLGISETNQETPPVNPIVSQTQEKLNPEARQILQNELKILIEERRTMVDGGAKASEIQDITKKIQEKSRALSTQPPLVSRMSADVQKVFDQELLARKTKLDELGKAYKELIDRNAPKEEMEPVIKQINEARGDMQRFVQTSMQPPQQPSPPITSQEAPTDHSGHQH